MYYIGYILFALMICLPIAAVSFGNQRDNVQLELQPVNLMDGYVHKYQFVDPLSSSPLSINGYYFEGEFKNHYHFMSRNISTVDSFEEILTGRLFGATMIEKYITRDGVNHLIIYCIDFQSQCRDCSKILSIK